MNSGTQNSTDKYGINLGKIQENFKNYRTNTADSFNSEKQTGTYNYSVNDDFSRFKSQPSTVNSNSSAEKYKSNFIDDVKKFMSPEGAPGTNISTNTSNTNTTTNTTNTTTTTTNADQGIGNKGDLINSIGDNNTITNSNIGNDLSVNIGSMGTGNGSGGTTFNNLEGAANYAALNRNDHERSKLNMTGSKRAAQASKEAEEITGGMGRAARMYNSVGMDQKYWGQKSNEMMNFYLGDVWNFKAPEYNFQDEYADPFKNDRTKEITDKALDDIKDS